MVAQRLALPEVTLCAATSVNLAATVSALRRCLEQVDFADCLLLTDASVAPGSGIRTIPIPRLSSGRRYSEFVLTHLADFIETPHCLVVQWDGFVLDADQWDPSFLGFDYIGAPWPQFNDGRDVGNGGFSLRSRRLLEACRHPTFRIGHPEDVAIGRTNRTMLEERHGIRFASRDVADRFAFERTGPAESTFGFHGVFNMIPALGADAFWELYESLDEKSSALLDYRLLMSQLRRGQSPRARQLKLTRDRVAAMLRR
jgi:hypothetical protein